jgi:DNA-binding transcriptional ArsR family regulator
MDLTSITPSPTALKALAHPVRLRILGLLRIEGPATATRLAARLGLNSGATSYHLRQLAQHGFVVDDEERGNARDRWWKAAHQSTSTGPELAADPAAAESLNAFLQSIAVVATEQLQQAVEEWSLLPEEWRQTTEFSDWIVRLTPGKARRLVDAVCAVIAETDEDADDEPGAEHFVLRLNAYPLPGAVTEDPS